MEDTKQREKSVYASKRLTNNFQVSLTKKQLNIQLNVLSQQRVILVA